MLVVGGEVDQAPARGIDRDHLAGRAVAGVGDPIADPKRCENRHLIAIARSRQANRPASPVLDSDVGRTSLCGPVPRYRFTDWHSRGITAEQRNAWLADGLRPTESTLAEQCADVGLEPGDLKLKLSGQSAIGRLRGGESAASVWARPQEGQAQQRGIGRLKGRFA